MAPASRTRPPTSGSRDGDGEALELEPNLLDALGEAPAAAPAQAASEQPLRGAPDTRVPPAEPSSNPSEWPFPVLQLVHEARAASTDAEREDVAGRLNQLLDDMAREGGSRQVADVFHGLLDGGALEGLVDARGRTCHAAAVEGLLSLGFPYALEIRPEDLEEGRGGGAKAGVKKDWRVELPSLLVVLTGVLGQFLWDVLGRGPAERYPPTLLALTLFALVAVVLGPSRSALRGLGVVMLAVVSALSVLMALVPGYAGLAAGLAGLLAAFLAARQES